MRVPGMLEPWRRGRKQGCLDPADTLHFTGLYFCKPPEPARLAETK